jgi:hypothetical protein
MDQRYIKKDSMSSPKSYQGKKSLMRLFRLLFHRITHPTAPHNDQFPIVYYKKGKCSRRKLLTRVDVECVD